MKERKNLLRVCAVLIAVFFLLLTSVLISCDKGDRVAELCRAGAERGALLADLYECFGDSALASKIRSLPVGFNDPNSFSKALIEAIRDNASGVAEWAHQQQFLHCVDVIGSGSAPDCGSPEMRRCWSSQGREKAARILYLTLRIKRLREELNLPSEGNLVDLFKDLAL